MYIYIYIYMSVGCSHWGIRSFSREQMTLRIWLSRPKSNLGIRRVPFLAVLGLRGVFEPQEKGNKGLLWA